jgi:hypothetical protein
MVQRNCVALNSGITLGSDVFCAVGVRWLPACEDMSSGAEEFPLLQDITKQRSEDCN